MPLQDLELEKLELKYLDKLESLIRQNLNEILERLRSRFPIFSDWYPAFRATARKGYIATDLDKGAEKVFGFFLSKLNWKPVAVPIASDFMYETEDAFIHVEIKTALVTNPSDYRGLFDIGENQTSFDPKLGKRFTPRLPQYYNKNTPNEKPFLTYAIQIVHVDAYRVISRGLDQNPVFIILVAIPNGQLQSHYITGVVRKGKQKRGHFRYKWLGDLIFRIIKNSTGKTIERVRIIYLNHNYQNKIIGKVKIDFNKWFSFRGGLTQFLRNVP
ncbi:MAG: hypothetical protein J7L39_00755 [Candidatus Aenigmarchaeota archaeon]|nr:hypothetical protein [Candidatus Aenigmarchaeota archaeon]